MDDKTFRALLDVMWFCRDVIPLGDTLADYANERAKDRGFPDWVAAWHGFRPE